ncbi:rod shape-determining protein MreC [Pseudoalteromonas tunicata]|jgi:rod shape-determining protein MreC|uniref:Cell shape-determining protein MreC n=1 Tax=Pseudoalteromonas tunicata D2 TaxID=87626 RepID=A4C802_9GAMM|nr:rod shape-determining protein MreC [Pseudoalteromonas tunicata]ATC93224.1 rod shape-determining protein MreC [Pseudoalteromonas tunicata]AXT32284.1 rod shape-determining protein MreC [Pseudoalteromonas tunicata]EAR28717.1 putative rod shape-determining protein [Pseudoalteromonas tunicata D2]MDP4985382.1 rod shape-determining protein MreC [Pseudoalteromonas tunicata]MDP5212772.1 rod shape-determining protein MreC [Pseudoalteromonas tunicata]
MNHLFGRSAPLQLRLVIAVVFSAILMFGDRYTDGASTIRTSLNTIVSPLFYLANLPHELFNWSSNNLHSRRFLSQENEQLKTEQLLQNEKLQRLAFLEQENSKLRALLGSAKSESKQKLVAQVLSVHSNPYSHQVVINKGTLDQVVEGVAVIDEMGIVGQVTQVGSTTSRVLLMTDTMHATPVRILRNNVRTVVEGIGKINQVKLSHVPHSMDIRIGDILYSSGLGGVFPEGYPVATVTSIKRDEGQPFAQVYAEPVAQLDRIRLLILLWQTPKDGNND